MAASQRVDNLPVETLKGVGPRLADRLARLGIHTVADVLFHLPLRYQDRTRVQPIGALRPGMEAVVEGTIELTEVKFGKRRMLLSRLSDGTGSLTLRFFHFSAAQQAALARGVRLRCFGEVRTGAVTLEIVHPEYRRIGSESSEVEEHLTPIYPATEGLQQSGLRKLTDQALVLLDEAGEAVLPELVPAAAWPGEALAALAQEWVAEAGHAAPGTTSGATHNAAFEAGPVTPWSLTEALRYVHRPPPDADLALLAAGRHPAQQRLVFEELLAHHLSLRRLRARAQRLSAPPLQAAGELARRLLAGLPFALTGAQQRVMTDIRRDMAQAHPMQRLVQGDVGSGKTVVAALAALDAVEAGFQVAVMAPTELLAEQHLRNFAQWFEPLGIPLGWLAGRLRTRARNTVLAALASGELRVVLGTHALFQAGVDFHDLGLVIVDEQHRFGVHQRLALREKGQRDGRYPHQLIMTATPIPRTLAMTAYADVDCSVIDELPPGRTPVETVVLPDNRREAVVARVRHACAEGRQVYWVCTLIEGSEALQCQAAEDTARLLAEALPGVRVGLVHGRMKGEDKERIMAGFKAGECDLLVATTVIEVGVDVPNATLMIIENAERLGLAQLHQLRGRVGRGTQASVCLLMYHSPLSAQARERLAAMRETTDGFEIARRDLALRGPGEVLGTRQTGMPTLRIADVQRDEALLPVVFEVAERLLAEAPVAVGALVRRWVGDAARFGEV